MGYVTFDGSLKWPGGRMPYVVDELSFPAMSPELAVITAAVGAWNGLASVVRLEPRTSEPDYIAFVPNLASTASQVGRRGGRQAVQSAYFPAIPATAYLAAARQGVDQVDCFYIDIRGAVRVSWVQGSAGVWQGPVGLTPPGAAQPGAPLATVDQFGQLDLLFVDTRGHLNVMWVSRDNPQWQGPVDLTPNLLPADAIPAGARLLTFAQTAHQIDVMWVDARGRVTVMWVSDTNPQWQGPVKLTSADTAPPGAALGAAQQFGDQVDVLFIDKDGKVTVIWVTASNPAWQGPVRLTDQRVAPDGSPIATIKQSPTQLDIAFVDKDGKVAVMSVSEDNPTWQGPTLLTPANTANPGSPIGLGGDPTGGIDIVVADTKGSIRTLKVTGIDSTSTASSPVVIGVDTSPATHTDFVRWTAADHTGAHGSLNGSGVRLDGPMGTAFYLNDTLYSGFDNDYFSPRLPATWMVEVTGGADNLFALYFEAPMVDLVFHLKSFESTLAFPAGTEITKLSGTDTFVVHNHLVIADLSHDSTPSSGSIRVTGTYTQLDFELAYNEPDVSDGVFLQLGASAFIQAT